jgi:hypothetical protein
VAVFGIDLTAKLVDFGAARCLGACGEDPDPLVESVECVMLAGMLDDTARNLRAIRYAHTIGGVRARDVALVGSRAVLLGNFGNSLCRTKGPFGGIG